jgi:hypothetical protein
VVHKLPRKAAIPVGKIPVNANDHRLDPYLRPVSANAMEKLRARRRRVCNNFHLTGSCSAGGTCTYDHDVLEPGDKRALETLARSLPCPKRGSCRSVDCTLGHVCQMLDCKHRGGRAFCKIPYASHLESFSVVHFEATTAISLWPPNGIKYLDDSGDEGGVDMAASTTSEA